MSFLLTVNGSVATQQAHVRPAIPNGSLKSKLCANPTLNSCATETNQVHFMIEHSQVFSYNINAEIKINLALTKDVRSARSVTSKTNNQNAPNTCTLAALLRCYIILFTAVTG